VKSPLRSVVIRSTSGVFEPRFISIIKFLSEISADITAIRWSRTVRESEILEPHDPWVFKAQANYGDGFRNYYSHLKFMYFTYASLKRIKPNVVYACDLDTLIPALVWGQRKSSLLIFDQFDPLSAKSGNPILSGLLDRIELALSKKAHFRVTPNLNRISVDYANDWFEIKNLFELENLKPVDQPSSKYLQLFYGGVLSKDRGLIALSSAVVAMPRWQFQVFGQGPEFIELKTANHPRIVFKGLVDHKLLMQNAQKANIYAALYDPKFKHNQKTASNKLFEAAQLGIPLLASKNTYLGEIVERYGLGWSVHYDDIQEIIGVLAKFESMQAEEKLQIKMNLQEYFAHELIEKRESLNRLSNELKKSLEA
jgi:glycosyltransferase involved in cell wall biosynthesis